MVAEALRVQLLGEFKVYQGSRSMTRFRTAKAASLFAYLAYHRKREHPREELAERFWPEAEVGAGLHSLSQELSSLRRQLDPVGAVFVVSRQSIHLNPEVIGTDVHEFEGLVRAADRASTALERIEGLLRATDLYHGELLPGMRDEWIVPERERLSELLARALGNLSEGLISLGRHQEALDPIRRLTALNPLDEEAHETLIETLMTLDRPHEARAAFERLEKSLLEELGERPSRSLAGLVDGLSAAVTAKPQSRRPEPTKRAVSTRGSLPPAFSPFIGREREIEALTHLLLPGAVASPRARLITLTGAGGSGKTRLALEVARRLTNAFDGRSWFVPLADLGDPRLVPQAVFQALHLGSSDAQDLLEEVVSFLNSEGEPSLLVLDNLEHLISGESREDSGVASFILDLLTASPDLVILATSRQCLLIEPEMEFVVEPLDVPSRGESLEQLQRNPSVRLFVDRAQAARPDFVLTRQNAPAVAAICARLEGMPLAVELAALRSSVLKPREILEQVGRSLEILGSRRRDVSGRHRTLYAAIDWSLRLLTPDQQRHFARLSVFRGGFTVASATAVLGLARSLDTVEALEALREASLLRAGQSGHRTRYSMLEPLREFGWETMSEDERAFAIRQHFEHFARFAEDIEPYYRDLDYERSGAIIEPETQNLRAAIDRFDPETASNEDASRWATTVGTLVGWWAFMELRSHFGEAERYVGDVVALGERLKGSAGLALCLEAAAAMEICRRRNPHERDRYHNRGLAAAEAWSSVGTPVAHARAQLIRFKLAALLGDREKIKPLMEELLSTLDALPSDIRHRDIGMFGFNLSIIEGARWVLDERLLHPYPDEQRTQGPDRRIHLAALLFAAGWLIEATDVVEDNIVRFSQFDDWHGLAVSYYQRAAIEMELRGFQTARIFFSQALRAAYRTHYNPVLYHTLGWLAGEYTNQGRIPNAKRCLERALYYRESAGDPSHASGVLCALGHFAFDEGRYEAALALYSEAVEMRRAHGSRRLLSWGLREVAITRIRLKDFVSARKDLEETLRLLVEQEYLCGVLDTFELVAVLEAEIGNLRQAATIAGAAVGKLRTWPEHDWCWYRWHTLIEPILDRLANDPDLHDDWLAGASLGLDDAVALCLASAPRDTPVTLL